MNPKRATMIVTIGYLCWAAAFLWRASGVAIDGLRYPCLFDDAMITFRYAWNLAHGNGLVWTLGERIEGYTSTLHLLHMSVWCALLEKRAAILAIQLVGAGTALAIAFIARAIARATVAAADSTGEWRGFLVFATTLAYYPLFYWSAMGMETGLLAVLLGLATLRTLRGTGRTDPWLGVLLGLAMLTRPDAALPATILLLWRARHGGWRRVLAEGALVAGFSAALVGFRFWYFGDTVPNTYRLKIEGIPLSSRVRDGIGFSSLFAQSLLPALVLVAFGARANPFRWLLLGLPASLLAFQIYAGGDPWPYWRLTAPAIAPLFVLLVDGLFALSRIANATPARRALLIGSWWFFAVLVANLRFLPQIALLRPAFTAPNNIANINEALALSEVTEPDALIALSWAGTVPNFVERRFHDVLGKCDAHIARLSPDLSGATSWHRMRSVPGHNKYDLRYSILELRPDAVPYLRNRLQDIRAEAAPLYRRIEWRGVPLILRTDSPRVRWALIESRSDDRR